jgi:hypothetical protein
VSYCRDFVVPESTADQANVEQNAPGCCAAYGMDVILVDWWGAWHISNLRSRLIIN